MQQVSYLLTWLALLLVVVGLLFVSLTQRAILRQITRLAELLLEDTELLTEEANDE